MWAFLIGLGAVTMETIYCLMGFAGFSSIFDSRLMRATLELVSFCLLLWLGMKFMLVKNLPNLPVSPERLEERFHPHTAFFTGFVRALGNPAVLFFWFTISATLISHEWVEDNWLSKSACIAGVAAGALGWFTILSYLVSLGQKKLSERTLMRLSQVSGVFLLVVALFIGGRLVLLLREAQR